MSGSDTTQREGAWIFVSHSHHDLAQVRQIRNELEQRGHNPLLFFLKCLTENDARLPQLIREEIQAREWFILCDSPNTKNSAWVQQEVELIKSMAGKVFETIDLSEPLEGQLYKLVRLSKRATVFLSYGREDREIAKRIRRKLREHDYSVFFDEELSAGADWRASITSAIDAAIARGFVLVLLSPASLTNPERFHLRETAYALDLAARSQKSNVIPVAVSPIQAGQLPPDLARIQYFDLTTGALDERIEALIQALKFREME